MKPPIKGNPKKRTISKSNNGALPDGVLGVVGLVNEINTVKLGLTNKIQEVDTALSSVDTKLQEVDRTMASIEDATVQVLTTIKESTIQGEPGLNGKDADEEKIIKIVLSQVPKLDEVKLTKSILSQVPKIDTKTLTKEILAQVPSSKASLKIIQENMEIDPLSVIDKIMALPEAQRSKLQLSQSSVTGLDQTIRAFNNQITQRGYLHGGGISDITGLIQQGTNVTITGNGTKTNPYVINSSGSGGVTSFNTRTGAVTLTSGDVTTALGYTPQQPITLTTTGTSGVATFTANTLNIPNYTSTPTTPGGSTTQLQYNNAGAFGGMTNVLTDGTNLGLGTALPTHAITLANSFQQVFYNTTDQITNFERVRFDWASNNFIIQTEAGGTGTIRGFTFSGMASTLNVGSDAIGSSAITARRDSTGSGFIFAVTSSQLTSSSAAQNAITVATKVLQTGTASYRGIWVTPWISSKGSNGALLMDLGTNTAINASGTHTSKFTVSDTGAVVIAAGSATAMTAPLKLTAGTLLTTAEAGAEEFDGNVFYATAAASSRQVIPATQFITLTTAFTTAGGTTALQKLFNSPTNGTLTAVANTTYYFECYFTLSSISASSGTFSFGLGGTATYTRVKYMATAAKTALTVGTAIITNATVATATVLSSTANANTTGWAMISGKIVVGTGGTIIPSFATSVANATVVDNDSYFKLWAAGADTVQSIGNWN